MKRTVLMECVLALLALPAGVSAGSGKPVCSACFDIPFAFALGRDTMEAGRYVIQNDAEWQVLWVCAEGVRCRPIQSAPDMHLRGAEAQLVFLTDDGVSRLVFVQLRSRTGYRLPGFERPQCQTENTVKVVRGAAE
ncbi:MAG: hypothetical protein JXB46_04270 [Candidatus Eisenbacteria bacterium]|nr:hypothetical protein [Candidatus Eisenbacteria bacterium]